MASIAAAASSAQQQWRYDVFLSFRGEDTRNNFTSHLYKELLRKGIITFKDDRELRKGDSVPLQLPKAIQDSRILVVIFSKNYANSTWCLDELVKIFECEKGERQTILPIFYDVNPYEVRNQTGKFGEPFLEYEKLFEDGIEKVQQWRNASTEIANLSGWHRNDRDEAEFIQDIVDDILGHLRRSNRSIVKDFVGMESRLKAMNYYLDLGQVSKVRIIGICGMGGIGKTTIASVVYKGIYCHFEGSCFLQNVRESFENNDILSLQKQLLSATLELDKDIKIYDVYKGADEIKNRLHRKKMLVILDDVDQLEQLELLIGKKDEHWFGVGSRIIMTTRNEHLLNQYGVDEICKVGELNRDDSFKLFCLKAFNSNYCCKEEYWELSCKFVEYASGLPLALDVLGLALYGKSLREWNGILDRLKEIPNEHILRKLQLSYNGLDPISKEIFLDIACFFKGMEKDYVLKILESCGLFPNGSIGELIDKSLISISSGRIVMHDLIEEMGREIVRRESSEDLGLRSRIWLEKDLYHIQSKNKETKVKALVMHSWKYDREPLSAKIFSNVKDLRLLILKGVPTSLDIKYLPNELRYLEWPECPFKSFPSSFHPDKLVRLHMPWSNIKQLWKSALRPIEMLKVIDLSFSIKLINTLDFRVVPNLEELNLEGCENLREVHHSIGFLSRLVLLNLENCKSLVTLPKSICNLKSLWTLNLRNCSKLIKLPHRLGDMIGLEEFDASGIANEHWNFHRQLWWLPSFSALPFLKELNLSDNLSKRPIPNALSGFPRLKCLDLSRNNFTSLPSSISHLYQLNHLKLSNCKGLQVLPDLPSNIVGLYMDGCSTLKNLPNLFDRQNVKNFHLDFSNCINLLNDQQGNISVAFTWLKSYLLSFLKLHRLLWIKEICISKNQYEKIAHKKGVCMDKDPEFFMQLPGREIPEWFTYQSLESPLKIGLSPCQKWRNIAGFVVCFLISRDVAFPLLQCQFTAYSCKNKMVWSTCRNFQVRIFSALEHLVFFFVANHKTDHYECLKKVEITFSDRIIKDFHGIKKCGVRIVHEKQVQELMESNKPLETLGS